LEGPGTPHAGAFLLGSCEDGAMLERRIRIRWRDVDAYGHVNNAVYLTYLEEARDAWAKDVVGPAFDFVIVRIAIDYRTELSLEDQEVTVRCWGAGMGTSSIRTNEQIAKPDGTVASESESVIVSHDAGARRARPLSGEQRELLRAAIAADAVLSSPSRARSGDPT
jgi:acyl-CoA thioester hydrolase